MNDAVTKRDIQALQKLEKSELCATNKWGCTVLHYLAGKHDLDLLLVCVWLGADQTIVDKSGKRYIEYLQQWEVDYLNLRMDAWSKRKLYINTFYEQFERYYPQAFYLDCKPLLHNLWDHVDLKQFNKILSSGTDLSHPSLCNCRPPEDYAIAMAKYGWLPSYNDLSDAVKAEIDCYYPSTIWNGEQYQQPTTVKLVGNAKFGTIGRTIVCISDTHWRHNSIHVPGGDILVCAGDVCMPWHKDLHQFLYWLGKQTHTYKILVAGNHDKLIQNNREHYLAMCKRLGIIYLEDTGVELFGLRFWGSPWTPIRPRNKNNAFTLPRPELMKKWNKIPSSIDVLITHCPPYNIGDCNTGFYKVLSNQSGDYGLLKTVARLKKLKLHVFGHQHYGRGIYQGSQGTYFCNAAIPEKPAVHVFT